MSKKGRKGRISNELVAASCAGILTVYASGYWRTRDEARRFADVQARPVRAAPVVSAPASAPIELPAAAAPVPPAATMPQPAAMESLQPVPAPVKAALPVVATPAAPAIASVSIEEEPAAEPETTAAGDASGPLVLPASTWHDGYFTGWGQSRHGDIEARVTIKDGRIVDAGIVTCATRYPCSVIDSILNQPVLWQSPDVDRVSRATESADAYYGGLVEALKKSEAWPAAPVTSQ